MLRSFYFWSFLKFSQGQKKEKKLMKKQMFLLLYEICLL